MATDLANSTRNLFAANVVDQVFLRIPMLNMFMEHRRVTTKGGLKLVYDLVMNDAEDDVQWYSKDTGLTVSQSAFTEQAKFLWKYAQLPLRYAVDTEIENQLATSATKRRDVVKLMVKQGLIGFKNAMNTRLHSTSTTDTGEGFQSVPDALEHSRTYGEITTTTTANAWWNGASLADSYSDRATEMAMSLANLRTMLAIVRRYVDATDKQYLFLPEGLYNELQGLMEGKRVSVSDKDNSKLFKYNLDTFQAYRCEVVMDSWMTKNSQTATALLINPNTFQMRLHPDRAFSMRKEGFVWQGNVAGGKDENVARMLVAGNLCCNQPNGNMWKSNVT